MILYFLFIVAGVTKNMTFVPSLGLLKNQTMVDMLITKGSMIEKTIHVRFSSPKVTPAVKVASQCLLYSRNNSRLDMILSATVMASFGKFIKYDSSDDSILDDPLFNVFLDKHSVPRGKDNLLMHSTANYTISFDNGYYETTHLSMENNKVVLFDMEHDARCTEVRQTHMFIFMNLQRTYDQVIVTLTDKRSVINRKEAMDHFEVPRCTFKTIKKFTFVTSLVFSCEVLDNLTVIVNTWNAEFCRIYKFLSIIPIPVIRRKKRQILAAAALAFSGGILMSNLFHSYIGTHESSIDSVSFEELRGNQNKLQQAIFDLDKSLTIFEDHANQIFHDIDKHFCELSIETILIREELISFMIMHEFVKRVEDLLITFEKGMIPENSRIFSVLVQMCITLNYDLMDSIFVIEDICKETVRAMVILLQKISVT